MAKLPQTPADVFCRNQRTLLSACVEGIFAVKLQVWGLVFISEQQQQDSCARNPYPSKLGASKDERRKPSFHCGSERRPGSAAGFNQDQGQESAVSVLFAVWFACSVCYSGISFPIGLGGLNRLRKIYVVVIAFARCKLSVNCFSSHQAQNA